MVVKRWEQLDDGSTRVHSPNYGTAIQENITQLLKRDVDLYSLTRINEILFNQKKQVTEQQFYLKRSHTVTSLNGFI